MSRWVVELSHRKGETPRHLQVHRFKSAALIYAVLALSKGWKVMLTEDEVV